MKSLRENYVAAALTSFEGNLRSGEPANNKLVFDNLKTGYPELYKLTVGRIGKIINAFDVDFVVPVPDGARQLAQDVAWWCGVDYVDLIKVDDKMAFANDAERLKAVDGLQGAVVEDVFTRLTNTRAVLSIPIIGEKAVVAAAIFDRGNPAERGSLSIATASVVREYIPPILPDDHPYQELLRSQERLGD